MNNPQDYLEKSLEMFNLAKLQAYWYFPAIIISTIISIIGLYFLYKIMKNSNYILKMKMYEFEKNNPEKTFSELINDRYAFIKVKF